MMSFGGPMLMTEQSEQFVYSHVHTNDVAFLE